MSKTSASVGPRAIISSCLQLRQVHQSLNYIMAAAASFSIRALILGERSE
jgi:hypothetical protein